MTQAFDNRIVSLDITIDGETTTFDQNYYIHATGTKYTDGSLGECALRIDNISKTQRDFLVTKTSPWVIPRTYAKIALSVGRQSYGTFLLFAGEATACNPTQPPDIGLIFTSLTLSVLLGSIGTLNMGPIATLKSIAQKIADQLQIPLDYEATYNPQVGNYSFSGPIINQVQKLNDTGGVVAFVDNNKLVVIDSLQPRTGGTTVISAQSGMIGVPEVSELGVRVKMLILNELKVGNSVTVQSNINPAASGTFIIYKLSFEVASRETPFYWILELRRHVLGIQ